MVKCQKLVGLDVHNIRIFNPLFSHLYNKIRRYMFLIISDKE
jgi:hypothetical protein